MIRERLPPEARPDPVTTPAVTPRIVSVAGRLIPPAPTPPPNDLPATKLLRTLRRNSLEAWPDRCYEELVSHRRFMGVDCFLVSDPDGARHVLSEHGEIYERPVSARRLMRPVTGEGLPIAEGDAWRGRRRLLAPAFNPQRIERLFPHVRGAVEQTIGELAGGGRVDLAGALEQMAVDMTSRTMFSLPLPATARRRIGALVRDYYGGAARATIWDFLARSEADYWWSGLGRSAFSRKWFAEIDAIIAARRARPTAENEASDLLDLLFSARNSETGEALSHAELRSQAASLMVGGFETTARVLFWAAYLLSRDQDEQSLIRAEIAAHPPEELTTLDGLKHWPRLRRALLETLRLYPPLSVLPRVPRAPDVIAGVRVPPGSLVMISPWLMHRHRRLWDNPQVFMPERFGDRNNPYFGDGPYMPFGGGRRACLGAAFAMTEMTLALGHLLHRFEITLDDDRPVTPVATVSTAPSVDPLFRLKPLGRG